MGEPQKPLRAKSEEDRPLVEIRDPAGELLTNVEKRLRFLLMRKARF